ncbi:MAG: hypothetical protein RSC92_03700, partial [Clostridia bacterium]
ANNNNNYNLFNSNELSINILNNRFIVASIGDKDYISMFNDYLTDKWYGICINLSNESSKISFNIWDENSAWEFNKDLQPLCCIHEDVIDIIPILTTIDNISIKKCFAKITNIRLYSDLLLNTKQQLHDLCSRKTKDADKAIILDDANIINVMDYINKPR